MAKWNPFLTDEESDFYNTVFEFSKEKIYPSAEHRDEKEIWDPEIWNQIAKAGLAGLPIPSEYGGQNATCFQCCLATEAFASGSIDGGLGLSWSAHMIIGTMPILLQGNEAQKNKYLPRLASGEWIAGLALTEASSGSDAASLLTRAEETEDGYILNGSKMYITNGPVGQLFIVMARTGNKSRGPMGVSAFLVESSFPGFKVSKLLRKLGHHTSMTAELVFEDMFVPQENLLGPLGSGFLRIGKATLEWERTVLIAGVVGAMEYALESSLNYAKQREQFGKSISNFYAIQEKIVKIWLFMNSARLLIYYAAKEKDKGGSLPLLSSVCKLYASEVSESAANDTIQIFGGYGFMREYQVERFYRDIKLATIGGGTSEIQRSIIFSAFSSSKEITNLFPNLQFASKNLDLLKKMNLEENYFQYLLDALHELHAQSKSLKHQSLEFACSDIITYAFVIDTNLASIKEETNWYSFDQKILDLQLLMPILFYRYVLSFQNLQSYSPHLSNYIKLCMNQHLDYKIIESCFKFLESRL
jgi:alkylation response protein AidB-like acyl-CoA dehydrogenase